MDNPLLPITVLFCDADTLTAVEYTHLCVPMVNGRVQLDADFRQGKLIVAVIAGHVTPLPHNTEAKTLTVLYYPKYDSTLVETAHLHHTEEQHTHLTAFRIDKILIAALPGHVTILNKAGERWGTLEQMAAVGDA